jgi:hypothetical protein
MRHRRATDRNCRYGTAIVALFFPTMDLRRRRESSAAVTVAAMRDAGMAELGRRIYERDSAVYLGTKFSRKLNAAKWWREHGQEVEREVAEALERMGPPRAAKREVP